MRWSLNPTAEKRGPCPRVAAADTKAPQQRTAGDRVQLCKVGHGLAGALRVRRDESEVRKAGGQAAGTRAAPSSSLCPFSPGLTMVKVGAGVCRC